MLQTERILLSIFIGSFLLNLHLVAATDVLLLLSGSLLAILYFLFSIPLINRIPLSRILKRENLKEYSPAQFIMSFVLGIGLSESVLGLLFTTLGLSGTNFMLTAALLILLGGVLYGFINLKKHKLPFYKRFFQRSLGFAICVGALLLLPKDALLHYKYSEYPAYLEARAAVEADPENEALIKKLNDEIKRIGHEAHSDSGKTARQP